MRFVCMWEGRLNFVVPVISSGKRQKICLLYVKMVSIILLYLCKFIFVLEKNQLCIHNWSWYRFLIH